MAVDLDRLGRRLAPSDRFLIDRLVGHVKTLDSLFWPTAGQRVREMLALGVDEDEAVVSALAEVDARSRLLDRLLDARAER